MKKKEDWRMPEHMGTEEDVTEKQMVGNKSEASNFILKCIRCGASKGLSFVAHRNVDECITGFIVVCQTCFPIIGDTKKRIKIVMSSK